MIPSPAGLDFFQDVGLLGGVQSCFWAGQLLGVWGSSTGTFLLPFPEPVVTALVCGMRFFAGEGSLEGQPRPLIASVFS